MKIQRNNVTLNITKPEVHFDTSKLAEAEKKKVNEKKALLIATGVVAAVSTIVSQILKLRKRIKKK